MLDLMRRQLDNKLSKLKILLSVPPPPLGWLRNIREAIGMTHEQLAKKLKMSRQAIAQLEKSEAKGSITLNSLKHAAEMINCQLVYVLIPKKPLEDVVNEQMLKRALKIANYIDQSMILEDQKTDKKELDEQIKKIIEDIKRRKDISLIWDDDL